MRAFEYIGSKISCIKAKVVDKKLDINQFIEGVNCRSFTAEPDDSLTERNVGFVDYQEPFTSNLTKSISDKVALLVYRIDTKKANSTFIKKSVELLKAKKASEGKVAKRVEINEAKEQAKSKSLKQTPYTTKLVPVIVTVEDDGSNTVYVLTTSANVVEEVLSEIVAVADCELNVFTSDDNDKAEFLTWLWWRYDCNQFFALDSGDITLNGNASIQYDTVTTSTKGGLNELRTAMSVPEALVTKLGIDSVIADTDVSFEIDNDLTLIGFKHGMKSDNQSSDEDDLILTVATLAKVYSVIDEGYRLYQSAVEQGEHITNEIRKTWSRDSFCTKDIDI